MWFINDTTIKKSGCSESEIVSICKDNNIRVGNACHKGKYLGRVISDVDYPILIRALANES
jgi:hypothetical protein